MLSSIIGYIGLIAMAGIFCLALAVVAKEERNDKEEGE